MLYSDSNPKGGIEIIPGVWLFDLDGRTRIATRSKATIPVYGERIVEGYRIWDPWRSKLASLLLKDALSQKMANIIGSSLKRDSKVLYLGAATGTTVSHISDIVEDGLVYAVEISPRSIRDLLVLSKSRENIIPILADASMPFEYSHLTEPVDLIYQDIAQRNQAEIARLNADRYLKSGCILMLMIKSRCVDVNLSPVEVYSSELSRLQGLEILSGTDLLPYHHDHLAVVARKLM